MGYQVDYTDLLPIGITATSAPSLPSLRRIHRPSLGSFDRAATKTMAFFFEFFSAAATRCEAELARRDGATSCKELTNPGAGIVDKAENDRPRSSIFQSRMQPSQEPVKERERETELGQMKIHLESPNFHCHT